MNKLTVGQELYRKEYIKGQFKKIATEKVKTVGRKYFTIENHLRKRFYIGDLNEDTSRYDRERFHLKLTKKEILEDEEYTKTIFEIDEYLRSCNLRNILSLDEARSILNIIKKNLENRKK